MSVAYDAEVGIVGAGPAGARAAELLARQGVDVLMLDPRAPWEKPCGGGLTSPAFREMPELVELVGVSRETTSARVWTPEGVLDVPLDRPIRMISRRVLASWQLDRAVDAGARHEAVKVIGIRRTSGGWRLRTPDGGRVVRVAVGADGAASVVRRVASPGFQVELAPTRVRYPRVPGPHPEASFLRLYPEVSGYLWDFPRPDHRSVGIMVTRHAWTRARMDEEIDGYLAGVGPAGRKPAAGREIGGAPPSVPDDVRAGAVIGTAQLGHRDYRTLAGDDFALLGDAAGLADPLTGEGIRNALRSAALLADAWREGGIQTYPQLARRAFDPEFRAARRLRRVLLDTGLGGRIVIRASRSPMARAFVAGCLNALNESEMGVRDLTGRWWSAFRSGAARPVRPQDVGGARVRR